MKKLFILAITTITSQLAWSQAATIAPGTPLNIFEGKKFELGSGVLKHPTSWWHLRNPWRPSWGEPYVDQVNRMLAAVFDAREAAAGKDAIVVSHQLPIWILRSAVEGRRFLHDPRKRICTLASVTSLHFDEAGMISGLSYSEPAKHLLP